MSQPCATPKCERISRALCDCCKQNLCLQHLTEHNALLISQLNPLTDEINALGDRLNHLIFMKQHVIVVKNLNNGEKIVMKRSIVSLNKNVKNSIVSLLQKLDRQREEILHIQSKLTKLIREQEATRQDIDTLTSTIRQLEKEMNKIEETRIQINTHPLVIR